MTLDGSSLPGLGGVMNESISKRKRRLVGCEVARLIHIVSANSHRCFPKCIPSEWIRVVYRPSRNVRMAGGRCHPPATAMHVLVPRYVLCTHRTLAPSTSGPSRDSTRRLRLLPMLGRHSCVQCRGAVSSCYRVIGGRHDWRRDGGKRNYFLTSFSNQPTKALAR